MANNKLNFEDFQIEKLSKNQHKTIQGGDDSIDPSKGTGKGSN